MGKADPSFLRRYVYGKLGVKRPEVLVGPRPGVDNGVVRLGGGMVLVATTDPLSLIPSIGTRESARLSVHLLASDLTTSGFPPKYGIFDFNLPPKMSPKEFGVYWEAFHRECRSLGLAVLGGHTGWFEGCDYTITGGGVMLSTGPEKEYLSSDMAQEGDEIIITKGAAISSTAILARSFPWTVRRALGEKLFQQAWNLLPMVSTVKDALTAVSVGVHGEGVTAMHDATEGGVLAAIIEVAAASNLGLEADLDSIPMREETRWVCSIFNIDPFSSLGEGSLVIASKSFRASNVVKALRSARIDAQVVGRFTSTENAFYGTSKNKRFKLQYPKVDQYWRAFWTATRKGWR